MRPRRMFNDNSKTLPILPQETAADAILFSASGDSRSAPADWPAGHTEGQLAVDVVSGAEELVIIATMAGTAPENIELQLHNDFLTIRGRRESPAPAGAEHFYQECFWGAFSRTIVLPVDVNSSLARAVYHRGVLTIYLPKIRLSNTIPIMVVDE